jgi:hypothetical protein
VEGADAALPLADHIRAGLLAIAQAGRLSLLDADGPVAPGITRLGAAGHTPGHSVSVVSDGPDRALLLGDALYCPAQLAQTDWAALTDVDPGRARDPPPRRGPGQARQGGRRLSLSGAAGRACAPDGPH